jgi:hypothetical protein
MANQIVAGNSSNGGTAISTDTSGTLNIVTGSGSGANAITIDASQNVAMTASQTIAGNLTVTGTLTATGGVSGGIRSGTAVASTSGTSIDFTGIPAGIKRITVMFNGVSTNGTSIPIIQLGDAGGIENTGYAGTAWLANTTNVAMSSGFSISGASDATYVFSGTAIITLLGSNAWTAFGSISLTNSAAATLMSGAKTLSDTLTQIRITTVGGTNTFDAGTINILYE